MRGGLNPASETRSKTSSSQGGYILLTLIFFVAVGAIFALALTTDLQYLKQQELRDREDEMRHRGTQYMRAIRAYNKKTGRYPAKIEDLENTNNLRFLRRRYKDPLMIKDGEEQDFKLLHFGDSGVKLSGGGLNSGGLNGQPGLGQPEAPPGPNRGPLTNPLQNLGNPNQNPGNPPPPDPLSDPAQQPDPQQPGSQPNAKNSGAANQAANQGDEADAGGSSSGPSGPTFGGGAIVGVVSTSKKESVREFNHKHRYNQWLFYYDPQGDRGGLLNGPTQPQVFGLGAQGQLPGQTVNQPNGLGNPVGQAPPDGNPGQNPPPIGDPPPS